MYYYFLYSMSINNNSLIEFVFFPQNEIYEKLYKNKTINHKILIFLTLEIDDAQNLELSRQSEKSAEEEMTVSSPPKENTQNNALLDKIQSEKESFERELDIQITENRRLSRITLEQTEKIETLETTLSRLQNQSLDRSSLLEQIQSDKDTLSRALTQNKKLKEQLVELEEGFVKMVSLSKEKLH